MDRTNNKNSTTSTVRFTVGDVGGAFWEELSYGGTDYAGMNYGWPDWEGPCRKDSFSDCPIPPDNTDSSSKTKTNNAIIVEPFHYYQHRTKREGGAVAGQVFVPSTANWYVLIYTYVHTYVRMYTCMTKCTQINAYLVENTTKN